jgi:hypothetical protein
VKRKFIYKKDMYVIVIILLTAVLVYFVFLPQEIPMRGEVRWEGNIVMFLDIEKDGLYILAEHPAIHFRVENNAVAFVMSDCPDFVCVNTGYLRRPGQMAVCLPNRVSLVLSGDGGAVINR